MTTSQIASLRTWLTHKFLALGPHHHEGHIDAVNVCGLRVLYSCLSPSGNVLMHIDNLSMCLSTTRLGDSHGYASVDRLTSGHVYVNCYTGLHVPLH